MKINIKRSGIFLGVIASFIILSVPVYAALNSSGFLPKAQKFIDTTCSRKNLANQDSLLCYLFFKTGELSNDLDSSNRAISTLNSRISSQSSQISDLQNRVVTLESKSSPKVLFDEEFNGTSLDSTVWDIHSNGGNINLSNGELTLSSDGTTRFPLILPKNNLIPDQNIYFNNTFEFRMKYNDLQTNSGLLFFNATQDLNNLGSLESGYCCGVWINGVLFNSGSDHFVTPRITDTNYHTYKFKYQRTGFFYAYVDNVLVKTGGIPQPDSFWFGNPSSSNVGGSMTFDYIKITTQP